MRLQRDSYAPKSCAFDAANVQFLRAHLCKSHPVLQQAGQSLNGIGAGNVAAVLAEGNPDTAMKVFNRMFLALDYQRYPVRDEFACRGFLQAMLMGARLYSQIEVLNAFGRFDLEVDAGKTHWVFELKYLSRKERFSEKAAERL